MPLHDHFHPPLKGQRHWESFHGRWAAAIADRLNEELLPADHFAEFQVHMGGQVQVDVAAFQDTETVPPPRGDGSTATRERVWAPPAPAVAMPSVFPDEIEVQIFHGDGGPTLVAAIELVSPANKDRDDTRRAFAAKCASYLHQGVGLVVVDVVTSRQGNLHDQLVELMGRDASFAFPGSPSLYAVAYRPARRAAGDLIDLGFAALGVGQALPTMPLALRGSICLPIDLESTYVEVCQRSRL